MCSELLWWRCHRRLIADVMLFCGWQVTHILSPTECSEHRHADPVRVDAQGLVRRRPRLLLKAAAKSPH